MLYNLSFLFFLFITYSFLGKIGEIIYYSIINKKYTSRGFLLGPYIPLWGAGALIIGPVLTIFESNPLIVFITGVLIGAVIEYVVGYIQEKIYHARWWDYSNMKFNLHGRICLMSCTTFGILSLIYVYMLNSTYIKLLKSINHNLITIIAIIIFIIFIIDVIISEVMAFRLKAKGKLKGKDCTASVKAELKRMLFGR